MNGAFSKFDLTGKNAVVTAGGTGLGYQMTRALARAGARVLICSRREPVLKQAAEKLMADPLIKDVHYHIVDLSDRASTQALADCALTTFGGVDIFVGNAAEVAMEHVDNITDASVDRILRVNLASNVELMRAFLPEMRKKKWGRFIFSSTVGSLVASPHEGMAMYGATKAAINGFVRTAATETGHDCITVNSIVLGFYFTEMMRESCAQLDKMQPGASKAFVDGYSSMAALGRLGNPEEVEGLIQLLASDAGSYITGSSVVIDGGMSVMLRPNQIPE
jgi:NAD(P)-dependent dehydrogenase (short-subunit alcohol dehydrogenase family)